MTTHVLHAVDETNETVRWRCGVCQRDINFAKPGFGEPSATMFEFPENVDSYMDPCPGEYTGENRLISKSDFLDRFATEELGALNASTDARIRGMMFRVANAENVDLNHPQWLDDLTHAEAEGILNVGRTSVILQ